MAKINSNLEPFLNTKELNINVADMLLYVYQNELYPEESDGVNDKESLYKWLMSTLEMDLSNKENESLCNQYFYQNIEECKVEKYMENPYVKLVSGINIKDKNYQLTTLKYNPYQLFPLQDLIVDENDYYKEFTKVGYFNKTYKYLALIQDNKIWMSLNPNEINTMEPHIEKAKGNILVLGLGLGYFAYMCSLKEEVASITIIEKDQNIINLFKSKLLPHFDKKAKIKIIKSDAIDYINQNACFDYIFADLWHDPDDGVDLYYKLIKLENKLKLNISYWIENSLIAMLRRMALTILEISNLETIKSYKDPLLLNMCKKMTNLKINSKDDIYRFLSDSNLKNYFNK